MPFVGETGGVGAGQGMGTVPVGSLNGSEGEPDPHRAAEPGTGNEAVALRHAHLAQGSRRAIPLDPEMQRRLDEARRAAGEHADHEPQLGGEAATRRAPRPERLQR